MIGIPVKVKPMGASGLLIDTHVVPGEKEGFSMGPDQQLVQQIKMVPVVIGVVVVGDRFLTSLFVVKSLT